MAITWRPATWNDIEPGLSIQTTSRGDGLVGVKPAIDPWKAIFHAPFFVSCVLEATPPIRGHRLIGFAAAVLVSPEFVDAEIAKPCPDLTARIMLSVAAGRPEFATWDEVARANAGVGIDVAILFCAWRDDILSPAERHDVHTLLASSLAEVLAGFRIRRILIETTSEPSADLHRRSLEYQVIAEFPELGRVILLMTRESASAMPGSLGNVIFRFREPALRLRDSDRQLLLAALKGAIDTELVAELGITFSAVKARWRSTFSRIAESMPDLIATADDSNGRGMQKRHRILAYVRNHMEELRPYDWQTKRIAPSDTAADHESTAGPATSNAPTTSAAPCISRAQSPADCTITSISMRFKP